MDIGYYAHIAGVKKIRGVGCTRNWSANISFPDMSTLFFAKMRGSYKKAIHIVVQESP